MDDSDLRRKANAVASREDFIEFLGALRRSLAQRPS